jgi:hypothetical protein
MLGASHPGTDWQAVTAWATLGLAVLGLGAIEQFFEARRTRSTDTVRRLVELWHSQEVANARKLLKANPTDNALITAFRDARDNATDDYFIYLRMLDLFEEAGYSHRKRSRGFHSVDKMLGGVTVHAWERWGPVVKAIWKDEDSYDYFRRLAEKLARWRRFRARRHAIWSWMVSSDYHPDR